MDIGVDDDFGGLVGEVVFGLVGGGEVDGDVVVDGVGDDGDGGFGGEGGGGEDGD